MPSGRSKVGKNNYYPKEEKLKMFKINMKSIVDI